MRIFTGYQIVSGSTLPDTWLQFTNYWESSSILSDLLRKLLSRTGHQSIIDLCSGSGGPMLEVYSELKEDYPQLQVTLSDLFPDISAASKINSVKQNIQYHLQPVDATNISLELQGIRTMICSFHHLKPEDARKVLLQCL